MQARDGGVAMGVNEARHRWVDAAKGLSIILVVLAHTAHWVDFAGIPTGPVLDAVNHSAGAVRMPLFFLASGLFAGRWMLVSWRRLANDKLAPLVWVFLLWQVAMFGYKYLAAVVLPDQQDTGLADHLLRVLVAPLRPNAELWFLWALVVFFIGARLVVHWNRWATLAVFTAVSLLWSTAVYPLLGGAGQRLLGPGLGTFPMFFVFFIVGALFRDRILAVVEGVAWWVAALVAGAWIVAFPVLHLDAVVRFPGAVFVGQVIGIIAGISAAVLLARVRPITYLGERTLPVYLSHTTFVVVIACALYLAGVSVDSPLALAIPPLIALAAIALGLLLYRFTAGTVLFRAPDWFRVRDDRAVTADASDSSR